MAGKQQGSDGWERRESVQDLTIIGDEKGQVEAVQGLLIDVVKDRSYDDNYIYHIEKKNGDVLKVPGTASINRMLAPQDIGLFVRMKMEGWGRSANGKFKKIEVLVYGGEPTDTMLEWPSYKMLAKERERKGSASAKGHPGSTERKRDDDRDDTRDRSGLEKSDKAKERERKERSRHVDDDDERPRRSRDDDDDDLGTSSKGKNKDSDGDDLPKALQEQDDDLPF